MAKKNRKISKNRNVFTWITVAFLAIFSITVCVPLIWGFIQTFKDGIIEWEFNKFGFPDEWVMDNWEIALTKALRIYVQDGYEGHFVYAPQMMLNSVLLSTVWTFAAVFCNMLIAYACARFTFKGNSIIFGTVIITMLLPIVGALPSFISLMKTLRLYDTFIGTVILRFSVSGTYFLVFYAAFKSVNNAYTEAAKIDGANNYSIMFRIIFPLVFSTTMGIFILQFIQHWNDYTTQMIYLPSMPTIAYGLFDLQSYGDTAESALMTVRMAACFLACLPTLVLFVIFRNKIMGNLVIGGVK